MAVHAAATVGDRLSKFGALKAIFSKVPFAFAFVFVAVMFVSTVSQAYNTYEQSRNLGDLFIGVGKAIIKPIVASDFTIAQNVAAFKAGGLLWYQKIILWMTTMGALSTIWFVYKWIFLKIVTMRFSEGMNPSASIHVEAIFYMIALSSLYNTAHACNQLVVGWSGIWALFRNFSIVFEPILMIGEPVLRAFNMLPDANLPIFGQ